jgi:tetratricopeptide (TPR) repeat protein
MKRKNMGRIYRSIGIAVLAAGLGFAQDAGVQDPDMAKIQAQIEAAAQAMQHVDMSQIRAQIDAASRATQNLDMGQIQAQMERAQKQMELAAPMLDWPGRLDSMLAFAPFQQSDDAAGRAREQARDARDRARDAGERVRDNEERKLDLYREGTGNIDEGRYDQAVIRFNRLLETDSKWSRADGAYYWKAYALNKLGKRDEALAAVGEIQKQFPQSKWIADAKALQVEIQQAAGHPVSPDSLDDQDLKLLAINALMNSDAEHAVPLLEKVLNDPKNNLGVKSKALFVLAQSRSDKGRDIVAAYAKSGANPDLQLKAVGYLGAFRSKEAPQLLADIYAANNDVAVRRAALRGMANARDSAHLLNLAKTESNVDLRREAIRSLGNMQAVSELSQLYASESNAELKQTILSGLMSSRASDKLFEIARNEKNAELRGDAIRYLANMRGDKAADGLATLYGGESDKNVKAQIIRSLGSQGAGKQLVEVTRNEKDRELKAEGVQWLGRMRGSKEASDYLMELIAK